MGKRENKEKKTKRSFWEMYKNAPIKKKLTISHGMIIVSTFLLIVVLLGAMKGIESYVEKMYTGPVTNSFYIGDFRYSLADIPRAINFVRAEGGVTNTDTRELAEQAQSEIDADWQSMLDAHEILKDTLLSEESKIKLETIYSELTEMKPNLDLVMTHLKNGRVSTAGTYFDGTVKPALDTVRAEVETLDQEIYNVSKEYEEQAARISMILILVGVAMLVLVTVTAVVITRRVTKMIADPLAEVTAAAEKMRQGDMGAYAEITHVSEDELGILAESMRGTMMTLEGYIKEISDILANMAQGDLTKNFNEITDFLGDFASIKESFVFILKEFNKTLTNIHMVSEQVDRGSDEIATAANELAASTEEQASAVEELTATINTVTSMALDNAKGAEGAYQGVLKSVHDAEEKRKQVEELQAEMQRIKDISAEIANIITTIEEIADQTSLLSLNASIEAARAGEAGRGFAVVADQIGKLATDSAQAAVSTKELIEKTVAEIEKGNEITESTAVAFDSIIQEMTGFAGAANGSKEMAESQAEILKQVEEGINEVAAVTQENAASAEDSELGKLVVKANARIDVTDAVLEELAVNTADAVKRMEVKVIGFNGDADVTLDKGGRIASCPLALDFRSSAVQNLKVSGEEACCIEGSGSNIATLTVSEVDRITLDLNADKVVVDEKTSNANVRVYSDINKLDVKGSKNDIVLPACADIAAAEVAGDNIRVYGMGSVKNATVTGKGANVATLGTAVEGDNDTTIPQAMRDMMPTAAPRPTATPTPVPAYAYSGSITLTDSSWWTSAEVSMSDLLGNVAPEEVGSIVFKSNTTFALGYNNTTGTGTAAADNPYWTQFNSTASKYTVTDMTLVPFTDPSGELREYGMFLALSKGDGVPYKISWEVYTKDSAPEEEPVETGKGSITLSDSSWWTTQSIGISDLLAGVDAADVESITFTSNTSFILGYNNTTGDSPVVNEDDNPYWTQVTDSSSYTVSNVVLNDYTDPEGNVHQYYLVLGLSKGDGVKYTIDWVVNVKSADEGGDDSGDTPGTGDGETPGGDAGATPDGGEEEKKGEGSITFSDSGWWTSMNISKEELLAGVAAADVESITFTSDTSFVLGYKNNSGDAEGDDPNWTQVSDATTYTVSNVVLDDFTDASGNTHQYSLMVALSKGDGVEYTISWKVNVKATGEGEGGSVTPDDGEEEKKGEGSITFSDSGWWTSMNISKEELLAGVAVADVESITFTSDTSFVLGYKNNSGDAEGDDPNWTQVSDATTYTVSNVVLDDFTDASGNTHQYSLMVALSKGDGVEYTISWKVNVKATE